MKIYFVTDKNWYSKIMMKMLNEPFSHVGIGLFCDDLNLVIDCTKPYGKLYHFDHWTNKDKYEVVNVLELKLSEKEELDIYNKLSLSCINTPYDFGAYYYAFICIIRKYLFNKPLPHKNKWAGDGMWCVEIFNPIKKILAKHKINIENLDLEANSPYSLYLELKKFRKMKEIYANKVIKN